MKCIFLGYFDSVKGYRLWCIGFKTTKCIISGDVTFHEAEIINQSKTSETAEHKPGNIQFEVEPHKPKEVEPDTEKDIESVVDELDGVEQSESTESEGDTYQLARDRKRRAIKPPRRYAVADLISYALTAIHKVNDDERRTYKKAINGKDELKWLKAMNEEIKSLLKNETWKLIVKPKKKKIVSYKWTFKVKEGISNAEPKRFKARLVVRGFIQREGIDFNEVFSPMARHASIRIILALVAVQDMYLEQIDVKTTFLHGELQEKVVMEQPEGYTVPRKEDHVYLLKKSLYSLKTVT